MRLLKCLNENAKLFFSNDIFNQFLYFESFNTDVELSVCRYMDFCRKFLYMDEEYIFTASKIPHKYKIYAIGVRKNDGREYFLPTKGKGYPGEFYSGVLKCIEEMNKELDIDVLIFKTFDKKLSRLYNLMSKKFLQRLPGFRYEKHGEDFLYIKNGIEDLNK